MGECPIAVRGFNALRGQRQLTPSTDTPVNRAVEPLSPVRKARIRALWTYNS